MLAPRKNFSYKIAKNVFISKYLTKKFCTTAALKILGIGTLRCSGKKCYPNNNSIFFQNNINCKDTKSKKTLGSRMKNSTLWRTHLVTHWLQSCQAVLQQNTG